MITCDQIQEMPEARREYFLKDLCSRWKCIGCDEVIVLKTAAVIGNYCCGGCGMALLRPQPFLLTAVPVIDASSD